MEIDRATDPFPCVGRLEMTVLIYDGQFSLPRRGGYTVRE